MGRKKRIDADKVLETLERLGNGRAVARELNIHENTVYQIVKKSKKICARCSKPSVFGRTLCETHLTYESEWRKQDRKNRKRKGQCAECDNQRSPISLTYCEKHRLIHAENDYERKLRNKLEGAPYGDVQNLKQKHRTMQARYGEAGLKRWEESNHSCETCDAKYEEGIAIHMHHIDENRKNNTFENLICLCFRCHRLTHLLLILKDKMKFVSWFDSTYGLKETTA